MLMLPPIASAPVANPENAAPDILKFFPIFPPWRRSILLFERSKGFWANEAVGRMSKTNRLKRVKLVTEEKSLEIIFNK